MLNGGTPGWNAECRQTDADTDFNIKIKYKSYGPVFGTIYKYNVTDSVPTMEEVYLKVQTRAFPSRGRARVHESVLPKLGIETGEHIEIQRYPLAEEEKPKKRAASKKKPAKKSGAKKDESSEAKSEETTDKKTKKKTAKKTVKRKAPSSDE